MTKQLNWFFETILIFASITKCNENPFLSETYSGNPVFFKIWIFGGVCIYMFDVFVQLLITANNFLKKTFWSIE